jgi:6-phosphogluconolactonase
LSTSVVVHAEPEVLAQAVAARLVIRLLDAQADRGVASVVLTGGRIAAAVYRAVLASPARHALDWSRVEVWWGDERFLPAGHPERNETQARAALLDAVPLDLARVHPMPASDGPDGDDPEVAAARYAGELASASKPGSSQAPTGRSGPSAGSRQAPTGRSGPSAGSRVLPHFDLLLLGVGEDGHVASVFPEHPVAYESRPVSAVRGSPKPPPVRTTLTLPAINTAEEVWLIAAGTDKAGAVGMALSGAGPVQLPAAGVRGVSRTLWLLDRAAAAQVGHRLRSLR